MQFSFSKTLKANENCSNISESNKDIRDKGIFMNGWQTETQKCGLDLL